MQHSEMVSPSLPQIDIARIPELDHAAALFGTLADRSCLQMIDDDRAQLLACLYELQPGT